MSPKPATCHPEKPMHGKGMCCACYTRELRNNNPASRQAHRDAQKRYRTRDPRYTKSRRAIERRYRYGLSVEDYNLLIMAAGGQCGICGASTGKMCIDHDHQTGFVRGILCDRCNKALGAYEYMLQFEPTLSAYLSRGAGWYRSTQHEKALSADARVL